MKTSTLILFLIAITSIQACKEDCDECLSPPEPFVFEIVDKATGENLFSNGTYESDQVTVIDLADDSNVDFTFLDENDANLIRINSIGWQTEVVNFSFNIAGESIFTIFVDAKRKSEDCCTFTEYQDVHIENVEFDHDSDTGIYKILL